LVAATAEEKKDLNHSSMDTGQKEDDEEGEGNTDEVEDDDSMRMASGGNATQVTKKRVRKQSDSDKINKMIGVTIEKEFPGHGLFRGDVISYDAEFALFKIGYEDGDEEK
jgi:hypothetical protein